jgi:hypothetical protein
MDREWTPAARAIPVAVNSSRTMPATSGHAFTVFKYPTSFQVSFRPFKFSSDFTPSYTMNRGTMYAFGGGFRTGFSEVLKPGALDPV